MMFASLILSLALTTPLARAADWPDLSTSPKGAREGLNDAALIVAIEDYSKVGDVAGAGQNADDWVTWFLQGRGLPASRIIQLRDADATDVAIRREAARVATMVKPGGTLWVLYVGHGAPSRDGRDGLLVGVDADRSAEGIYARSVPQKELFALLDRGAQAQTVAVVDACFSGQAGDGADLVAGLQPLIPTALLADRSARTHVLTATGPGEFSGPLPGVARPAFSYLALGALRGWADADGGNGDGAVSASEVREWVGGALGLTVRGRKQTPGLLGEDVVLGRALDTRAPDLAGLARGKPAVQAAAIVVDAGGASMETTTDFAAIAAKASAAKSKRLAAEQEAATAALRAAAEAKARAEAEAAEEARLEAQLATRRRAELDRQAVEVRARATRDYAALAPLLVGELSAETKPVLEAYAKQYGDVSVRFDGVVEKVVIPEAEKVRAVLRRSDKPAEKRAASTQTKSDSRHFHSPTLGAMKWISAGTFWMGSSVTDNEHRVTLKSDYWMMEHEVTQEQWNTLMGTQPSAFPDCGPDCPVDNVSWHDAVQFARRASARDGVTYALPTEAQWERAARGNEQGPEADQASAGDFARALEFSFDDIGDDTVVHTSERSDGLGSTCWYANNSGGKTHPVCQKSRNSYQLCDMTGNVWEWTADWFGNYPGGAVINPTGPGTGDRRVLRGGSWSDVDRNVTEANRGRNDPGYRHDNLGLRLVRNLP